MAITDNTAKWQVKKLTNFTDKEREIATQAQAEEGVDNTKVMTPLRVKQAVAKCDAKNIVPVLIKDGTDLDTCIDVNFLYKSDGNGTYLNSPVAQGQAFTLEVLPWGGENARFIQRITDNSSKNNVYVRGRTGAGGFGTWKKIFNNSDIATQTQAEAGTDNTTVMTPLRTKQLGDKNYLTVKGGTLNGVISCNAADIIVGATSTNYINISGGNNYVSGANITLYGKDHPTNAGVFVLSCNGANALMGFPSGELYWNGRKLATNGALSMPSNNYINISFREHSSNPTYYNIGQYYAPADGYISVSIIATYLFAQNGISYLDSRQSSNAKRLSLLIPMRKDDFISLGSEGETDPSKRHAVFIYAQSEV